MSRIHRFYQMILGGLLTMLGFSSCDKVKEFIDDGGGQAAMYGCPFAVYTIKGTVTDEAGKPVTSADVTVRSLGEKGSNVYDEHYYEYQWFHHTAKVDGEGKYLFELSESGFGEADFRVVVSDAVHKADSVEFTMNASGGDKDNVWDMGSTEKTVDFTLKKL